MKSSFWFICVLIYGQILCSEAAVMPKSYYEGDGSTDSECTLRGLKTERNLDIDFPMSKEPPKCRFTWSDLNRVLRDDMMEFIQQYMPTKDNCVANELMKREKTLDLILTISSIQAADFFSESEKNARLVNFRNELKKDFKEIAAECQASEEKFITVFQGAFENNETLIAMETKYCLAKNAIEKGILTLPDVNLNPDNININNLNCSIVMAEELRKDEKRFRELITLRDEGAIACLMNNYRENKIFDLVFAATVLRDLKMPTETKQLGESQLNRMFARLSTPFSDCYKDKDFDADLLKYIEELDAKATKGQ